MNSTETRLARRSSYGDSLKLIRYKKRYKKRKPGAHTDERSDSDV